MVQSDESIQIAQTNKQVDFLSDPVYRNSNKKIKIAMRERHLTEQEYFLRLQEILEKQDRVVLNIDSRVDKNKLLICAEGIWKDKPTRLRMGEERFSQFVKYVMVLLLEEEPLSVSQLRANGFDPGEVRARARSILAQYYFEQAEKARIMRNPLPTETKMSTRRGMDPHRFLGDQSGRKERGYVR